MNKGRQFKWHHELLVISLIEAVATFLFSYLLFVKIDNSSPYAIGNYIILAVSVIVAVLSIVAAFLAAKKLSWNVVHLVLGIISLGIQVFSENNIETMIGTALATLIIVFSILNIVDYQEHKELSIKDVKSDKTIVEKIENIV